METSPLILNAYGQERKIYTKVSNYQYGGRLAIELWCESTFDDDDEHFVYYEPWSMLTVNLNNNVVNIKENMAYVDTNNNGEDIYYWVIENGLAEDTGRTCVSGFCCYPLMEFDLDAVKSHGLP